jgi:hypothetical protein
MSSLPSLTTEALYLLCLDLGGLFCGHNEAPGPVALYVQLLYVVYQLMIAVVMPCLLPGYSVYRRKPQRLGLSLAKSEEYVDRIYLYSGGSTEAQPSS